LYFDLRGFSLLREANAIIVLSASRKGTNYTKAEKTQHSFWFAIWSGFLDTHPTSRSFQIGINYDVV